MEGASFGAGRAGAALDPVSFARRPQTLLRVVSWVFSIAVFGPIVNEGYVNSDSGPELRCVFNGNAGACRFGVTLGLGAFLACAAFLLLDVRFQQISSVRDRPGQPPRRRETQRGPPLPSASSPSSAGWRSP
uniref:Synaptogyrin 3 n=1 Tax=Molossus molossus TaxID=27622 RepID=A0A7J8J434_MOLMO|nr:synaptogyrin 3 [Molossus molossus]